MLAKRPMGQGAASKKYDVLTALGAHACGGSKFEQRLVLRFMTAITARYNWQRDELTMGRAELARLWQVDERTVKRELAKLKTAGWVYIKRPAARGRVTTYAIDWERVLYDTRSAWKSVGPDFELRLASMGKHHDLTPETNQKVVAFPNPKQTEGGTEWDQALSLLYRDDPVFHGNWLVQVKRSGLRHGILELEAPSGFHANYLNTHAIARMTRAVQEFAPEVHRVFISSS